MKPTPVLGSLRAEHHSYLRRDLKVPFPPGMESRSGFLAPILFLVVFI